MLLLDTDVMVDILRQYPPAVAWLSSIDREDIVLPGFVVMELIQGCQNKTQVNNLQKDLLNFEVVWPSADTYDEALRTFTKSHLSHGIGILDSIIGQMAVTLGLPLYTFNQKHYAAISKLETIQPYLR